MTEEFPSLCRECGQMDGITDAQVEAAAKVFYSSQTGTSPDFLATSGYRDAWYAMARAALEAARSTTS